MIVKLSFPRSLLVLALTTGATHNVKAAELEEIIVTAQKRAQSIQDVPISVDVINAEGLQSRAINNAQDLAAAAPSLVFQKGGFPFANNFVIRGIGSMAFEGGIQPSVSFVVDGVPLSRISEFSADLGDIERVEILRGPQGTLYGRNATGGAVNIVRAEPTEETEGYVQQTITDDGEYTTRLMYNQPLNDKVNMRLSGIYTNRDDYVENVIAGNPDLGGEETAGVMAKFGIAINDGTELLVTADYRDQKTAEGAQHLDQVESGSTIDPLSGRDYDTIGAIRLAALGGGDPALGQQIINDPFKTSQDLDHQANMTSYGISFDLTHELANDMTLKSITAYRNSASYSLVDVDITPANPLQTYGLGLVTVVDTNLNIRPADESIANEIEYYSQEFRVEASTETMDWIAGVYYSHTQEVGDNTLPTSLENNAVFRADPKTATAEWDSYAAFGDMTFHITDIVDIFAGLRWTQEDMSIDYYNQVYQVPLAVVTPGAVVWGAEYSYLNLSDPLVANFLANGIPAYGLEPGLSTTQFKRDDTSADWSGRIGFTVDVADDVQVYASASRGFVGAGANIGRAASEENAVVNPSTTQAYELGMKSRWFDNSVQLNTALFWQEVQDLQTSRLQPASIVAETFNAGTLNTQGLEVNLDWAATDQLTLNGSLSYLDTEISELTQPCYPGQSVADGCNIDNGGGIFIQDVSGNDMILAPELAYTLRARYDIPLASMPFDMFAQLAYSWQDDTQLTLEYDPLLVQESYGLTDLTLGFTDKADKWNVWVFGKNIGDEYFSSAKTAAAGYFGQGRVASRTSRGAQAYWGVTAKLNF